MLNSGNLADAVGHLFVHSATDLKQHVDCLSVELVGTIKLVFLEGLISLGNPRTDILV